MGTEAIVDRILSDARAEAEEIVRAARAQAEARVAEAKTQAEEALSEAKAEAAERAARIAEGKASSARLDSAKILLAEKRRVLDELYAAALRKLLASPASARLSLAARLLEEYAEEGDEVLLAEEEDAEAVRRLPIFAERGLKLGSERLKIGGGLYLRGKNCDRDLSYAALLREDAEAHQAELAAELFR